MDRIRALIAEAQRYYTQLSARERLFVAAAGACFVLFVFSLIFSSLSHSIDRHEIAIEEKMTSLQKVAVYSQSYAENERARKEMEAKLGGPPLRLMSQLQEFAEKEGLTVSAMNDRGEQNLDRVKESLVELQIAAAPIDKLTAMLNDIEHDPRVIKVRKMRLRSTTTDNTALNVTLTIGSYQLLPPKS
jgi:type II secretory pathway component PulM